MDSDLLKRFGTRGYLRTNHRRTSDIWEAGSNQRMRLIKISCRLPTGTLATDLGLQVTGLAAGTAIVNSVFAEADFIEALAQRAVFVTGAASFWLVANHAHEFFGHGERLSRFGISGNEPMVDGLAVAGRVSRY
jgi:hypothetical protein